jgi:hypothetical protein
VSVPPELGRKLLGWVEGLILAVCVGCSASDAKRDDSEADGTHKAASVSGPTGGSGGAKSIAGGNSTSTRPPVLLEPDAGGDPEKCRSVSKTAEVEHAPVDIVWVIDTSASMADEIAAVQANLDQFSNMISIAGIDHHVVMLAALDLAVDTSLGMDPAHYQYVFAPVGSNDALQVLIDNYDGYRAFLRANASLHFVVVTDDESFVAAADFQMQMEALAGKKFFFHSIASPDAPGPCIGECGLPIVCGAFAPGIEYYALSDATGGQKISVCTADWTQVFAPLQQAVIESAPLPCDYPIPEPPSGEKLDPDRVNMEFVPAMSGAAEVFKRAPGEGECGSNIAWFYDNPAEPTLLRLCPSACERVQVGGGTINIAFGCETMVLSVD